MADVLDPPAPLFASRGGTSIKSFKFRERITSSSPPSIGGDSTRRRAFGMSSLLGRRTKNAPPPDLTSLIMNEKLVAHVGSSTSAENMDPVTKSRNPSRRVTEPTPAPQSPKSRTIFRKLTTRFNRSASPPPSTLSPKVDTTLASREARNAALRERGLLPPLPLSVQERQQDSRIAIVTSPEPPEQPGLSRQPTAANRIKEEWEAKNRERLAEFRFGGTSPMQEDFPERLESLEEVDTPLPSPIPSPEEEHDRPVKLIDDEEEPERKIPRAPPPTLNLSRGQRLSPPLMQAWSDAPLDPYSLPLPPSPSPRNPEESNYSSLISAFTSTPMADSQFTPLSPSFLPLPPSPSLSSHSFSTTQTGTETPRPLPTSPTQESTRVPPLGPSESESSLGVPSLMQDTESQTTVSTADSFGSFGRMRNAQLATRVRNSIIDPVGAGHHAISVIVESPGEERDVVLTSSPVEETADAASDKTPVPRMPQRRETEPTTLSTPAPGQGVDRRKSSAGVFKRGKGEGGLSTMASIRRSMGFGRAKSAAGPPAGFDASRLPPSPTLTADFASQQKAPGVGPRGRAVAVGAGHAHRLSVSPTMHSRGTILVETLKIEDPESRRMTEVAFM
ncbi:hypothetical protein FB45DRAFT_1017352 [Roridomyces roridus]|uniref:Uncharacterized protein n=1 Tax=Roridomyces roridus TaxID=1738132 RepID=A0AAD7CKJ5_9AGAR|nr:hypothetical protein FB45DRAFT_1017352 [Roridomyces roridus]